MGCTYVLVVANKSFVIRALFFFSLMINCLHRKTHVTALTASLNVSVSTIVNSSLSTLVFVITHSGCALCNIVRIKRYVFKPLFTPTFRFVPAATVICSMINQRQRQRRHVLTTATPRLSSR